MSLSINSHTSGLFRTNNNMANLTATVLGASGSSLLGDSDMSSLTKTVLGNGSGNSMISDYAAIKDGSYGKLLKAYYAEKEALEKEASEKDTTEKTEKKKTDTEKLTISEEESDKGTSETNSVFDKADTKKTLSSLFDTYI